MRRERVIVLKLGGSILRDGASLPAAVHEIYRWRRSGWRVVAVVSALSGTTQGLLQRASEIAPTAAAACVAELLAVGEIESAALLGLHLERAGIPAGLLQPGALAFRAAGDALDAVPCSVDVGVLRRMLEEHGVVVVPGFFAHDGRGRTVVLGRGGSDLTALVLADALGGARCRLVKDVPGLFERDPALTGPVPRRYARASFEDALATDGSILQRKALLHARARGLEFELAGWNARDPTHVGRGPSVWRAADVARPPLRVALLGLGTVGGGVLALASALPESFAIVAAAVRDPDRARERCPASLELCPDAVAVARSGADVVVEALGGLEPARSAIEAALRGGAHVVSANKAVLAEHGRELERLARRRRLSLRFSAAAGGSAPLLEHVRRLARDEPILRIEAVLNATTNFVVDRVELGQPFAGAVASARQAGFAERDATRDLSGRDAADKLVLLHHAATGAWIPSAGVRLTALTPRRLVLAQRPGHRVRHLATLECHPSARPEARVQPVALAPDHPLSAIPAESNAALVSTPSGTSLVAGKGAGRWPSAESVLADLLELQRELRAELEGSSRQDNPAFTVS